MGIYSKTSNHWYYGTLNPLSLSLPQVTKTEFLLTISVQYQTDKSWELRKISIWAGIISWSNTKFSELTLYELHG